MSAFKLPFGKSAKKMTAEEAKRLRGLMIALLASLLAVALCQFLVLDPVGEEIEGLGGKIEKARAAVEKVQKKLVGLEGAEKELSTQEARLNALWSRYPAGVDPRALEESLNRKWSSLEPLGLLKQSFQPVNTVVKPGYTEVFYTFNFRAEIQGLHAFLDSLKTFQTPITVKDILIQIRAGESKNPLEVTVSLAAFLRK